MEGEQIKPTPENQEEKNDYETTIRFDELDDESFKDFAKRVEESKGVVRVFIHPLHSLNREKYGEQKFQALGKELHLSQKPLHIMMNVAEKESAPPIIIFENADRVEIFQEGIEKPEWKERLPHPLYILPTLKDYPYPKLKGIEEPERTKEGWIDNGEKSYEYCLKSMTRFIVFLKEAGVKKVIVGGAELIVEDDRIENCVGNFINFFKGISEHGKDLKIDLQVSAGTVPHGRKELREKGGYEEIL